MKRLHVITNFGCHFECPNCVMKDNYLDVQPTALSSLDRLRAAAEYEKAKMISISGGGDPLFEYERHKKYYARLFRTCREAGIPVELHTATLESEFPFEKCHRVIYHLHDFEQLSDVKRHRNEIVRVEFVVTKKLKPEKIDEIAEFVKASDIIDELTFRPRVYHICSIERHYTSHLVKGDKEGRWKYLERPIVGSYFVNGTIHYRFSDISE